MASDDISKQIESMTLEEKVGQLFLLAYPGKDPQSIAPLVRQFGVCGCYISQDNADTFEEARHSTALLQNMEATLPMLLGVDQEGAWGVLVPESRTGPGNLALGSLANQALISDVYQMFGEEMLSVGYNALLAPCADTNSDPRSPIIGTRAFGEDYDRVAACVVAAIKGAQKSGVLTTIKHFPGHGSTQGDTHREIPYVDKSLEQLLASDLKPFAAGIAAGVDMVMTSHISYPQIDDHYPATLSSKILQDLLRKQLGFEGVILSDSMNMGAIRNNYDPAESTLLALQAGVDIVMLSEEHYDHDTNYLKKQIDSLTLICQAVRNGDLKMEYVDEKLRRIIRLKQKMLIRSTEAPRFSMDERLALESRVARESICLVKDHWNIFPIELNAATTCINATPRSAYTNIMNPRGIGPNQSKPAFDSFWETLSAGTDIHLRLMEHEEAIAQFDTLSQAERIVIVTEDYPLPGEDMPKEAQQSLVKRCISSYGEKCLVVGLRSPYELLNYPAKISYLCSYSSRSCSAEATARLLLEKAQPQGIHHITIS